MGVRWERLATVGIAAAFVVWTQAAPFAQASDPLAVTVPATAGPVVGEAGNSDRYIWGVFTRIVRAAPEIGGRALFESWALNEDVYGLANPVWRGAPQPEAKTVECEVPRNPWVGGFPEKGCIVEQVLRNKPQFDYIVANGLHSKEGLAAYFKTGRAVDMPAESISVKLSWVPLATLASWTKQGGGADDIRARYYTMRANGVDHGLVSMHVVTKANRDWVWSTFEHQDNPGRCDTTGCFDSFGAASPAVLPKAAATDNAYGACAKSPELKGMMEAAGLAAVWANYCLRGTQVSFTSASGAPTVLGNSVTERIAVNVPMQTSSCIACHVYASFGAQGSSTEAARTMFHYAPVGPEIPGILNGLVKYDYMWGVRNVESFRK